MINFVKKSMLFIIMLFLINFGISKIYTHLVLSHSYLYRTEAQFQAYKQSTHILIVGDSHPMSGVDTRIIPNSFSATSTGENIIETYYRLQSILEDEPLDIKMVILPLDVHTFSSFRLDRFNPANFWCRYLDVFELGASTGNTPKVLFKCFLGQFSYYNGLDSTIDLLKVKAGFLEGEEELVRGFKIEKSNNVARNQLYGDARNRAIQHLLKANQFDPLAQVYFLRLLALLDKNDIPAMFIKYPVIQSYYQVAGKYLDIDSYYADVQGLLDQHSGPYLLLDYHDLFWGNNDYFSDADHLNETGAIEFTKILYQDLKDLDYLP